MNPKKVIVVGAGIGGITAAIHLARHGQKVTVLEKNTRPGGRCDQLNCEGHRFDTGPTLMVMPLVYQAEFTELGTPIHEVLDLQRVDPTYQLVFDDGKQLALTSDLQRLQEQLETIEPGSFQGMIRYLSEGYRHYYLGMEKLVSPDFRHAFDFFKISNIPLLFQVKPLVKHYANMSHYFHHPRIKAAFTFQDVYMGLSPFEAPATFSLMPYSELAHGVWYPKGGMYQVIEALMSLALKEGVDFHFETIVDQIKVDGNEVLGVIVNGEFLPADTVLANADLPYVVQSLLPQDRMVKKLAHKRFSCSVISFFWGVDKPYASINPHTLFLADDYQANFDSIIRDLSLPANPSLYIHAPTRLDSAMAPEGQDTLIAVVPVGHISETEEQDWDAICDQARQHVFRRLRTLGIHDLEQHIKFEISFTPLSWRKRYNLVKGSTHGLCHNLTQLGYLRPDFQHPDYHNLFFTGASTRPGTGIPTAMISGRQAAQRILDRYHAVNGFRERI
jgi:phytoene desaturase